MSATEGLPRVTVLIPARDEAASIEGCLDAVAAQDYPLDRIEVLVVDGGSRDGTATLAEAVLGQVPFARHAVVANPRGSTPAGLNRGLAEATGSIVCRVDARSMIPAGYVRSCVEVLESRPEVVVVGGAQVALARSTHPRDLGIARALNNRWAMGGARYRRGAASGASDTVYLGAFRTAELRRCGGWDERFDTNQDYELNRRMGRDGIVWFLSGLEVGYVPRATLHELFAQYRRFGSWKVRYWRTTGDAPRPRQVALLAAAGLAPLAAVAAWTRLGRRGRAFAALGGAALAAVTEQTGPSGPSAPAAGHAYGLAASACVTGGWVSGVLGALTTGAAEPGAAGVARGGRSDEPVVYVVSRWGEPSQTFVRREAQAVAELGVPVAAVSLKRPVVGPQPDAVWSRPDQVLTGLARIGVRRPVVTAKVLATVVQHSRPGNVARQLVAAATGLSWAGSRRLPEGHLHAHFGWVAATAAWAAASAGDRSFSVSLHAFEIHDARYVDRFTPIPLRAALATFTESHRDQQILSDRWEIDATVARLGVPRSWLADADAERDEQLVVAVGRLVEKKGHDLLLRALAITRLPWKAVIVGDGPLRPDLEALIAQLQLGDRVRLAGALGEAEVAALLQRASISCLASVETSDGDRDGTPMALIEAMASGAAVVAADTGSIAELIGDAGVVVPARDIEALAAAIDGLADGSRRRGLARRAVARVDEGWTADRTARTVVARIGLTAP